MPFFAYIEEGSTIVAIVIIADDIEWCRTAMPGLTGTWLETFENHPTEIRANVGYRYDAEDPRKFIPPG